MKREDLYAFLSVPLPLTESFTLPSRTIMSPMEGLMNSSLFFQSLHALALTDFWMPPFQGITKNAVPSPGALRKKYKLYLQSGVTFFLQYLGHDPDAAAEGVRNAAEAGIRGINFNFACPSRTVLKSGSGGALLKDPFLMEKILLAAGNAVPGMCISVKIRTGFHNANECKTLLEVMKNSGVDLVICHTRTVEEKYSFLPEETIRKRVTEAVQNAGKIPFIGNGDICNEEKALLYLSCGCSGIAAARGLLKDPWLFKRLKAENSPAEEEGRKLFLEEFRKHLSGRKGAGTYAECVKIAFGEDSDEFRKSIEIFRKQTDKQKKYRLEKKHICNYLCLYRFICHCRFCSSISHIIRSVFLKNKKIGSIFKF